MSRQKSKLFETEIPNLRVDSELLAHLEQVFPNRLPSSMLENLDEYAFLHGQQQVVRYIKMLYEKKP